MLSRHRLGHCSSSMGTFAANLGLNFKSCETSDYGNKPIDLPFQSRNVTEFSSLFAACFFLQRNFFTSHVYIYVLLVMSVLLMIYISCFRKRVF